jgi:aspartate aminotransferase-like enzyme
MDRDDLLVMIPGPTNLPAEIRAALARPAIGHRGAEFAAIIRGCTEGLKEIYQTQGDVLILTSSGTGGLEAAIANLLSPGDPVLCVSVGHFGERIGTIAEVFGAAVTWLRFEWGRAADPNSVRESLAGGSYKAVLFTQNETSTGVTNPAAEIAAVAREAGALTIVDAISGMGGIEVRTDDWGLDVVVAGSQKALMLPPGLAFVSVSQRAWQATASARMPRYYFDLAKARESLEKGQTPYTPNTSLFFALQASLGLLRAEGLDNVWARHAEAARLVREGVTALGLKLFADPAHASNVVTSFLPPDGTDPKRVTDAMLQEHNILITGGQGKLRGKLLRIGHMGTVNDEQVRCTLDALGSVLRALR